MSVTPVLQQYNKSDCKVNLSAIFHQVRQSDSKIISVELCPDKNLNREALEKLSPEFCSIVWRSPSNSELKEISELPAISLSHQLSLSGNHVLIHLAGRSLKKSEVADILEKLQCINVRNIFVLQGEPSVENTDKVDFQYATDLIRFIKENYGNYFCIGVAAYPDIHPQSVNKSDDLKYLKLKVDAGADFIITQMVFEPETFTHFVGLCKEIGIAIPIIPGIFIINSYKALMGMTSFCRVQIPKDVEHVLIKNFKNPEAIRNYGIFQCSQMVKQLFLINDMQVIGVHFFSLNNIELVIEVCKVLGLRDIYVERPLSDNLLPYQSLNNVRYI